MGKDKGHRGGVGVRFEQLSQQILTSKATRRAIIDELINALGGPEHWCKMFAVSYEKSQHGTAVRMQLDKAILGAILGMKDEESIAQLSDAELEEAGRYVLGVESDEADDDEAGEDGDVAVAEEPEEV
jgi:hypothetical protein